MNNVRLCQRRSGFTLPEILISVVGISVLMVSLSSTLFIALRATDTTGPALATLTAHEVLSDMLAEMELAESIPEQAATAITFLVPDRNGDAIPEEIRYAWSGMPGEPLTRQYNGGPAATLIEDVHVFGHDLSALNLLDNADMEAGTANWEPIPGATYYADGIAHSGSLSIYTYRNSQKEESGIRQDISGWIVNGQRYRIGAWMRKWAAAQPFDVRVQLHIVSTTGGEQIFADSSFNIDNVDFKWVEGTVTPTWTGTLTSAWWEATGVSSIQDIYVDDALMRIDPARQNVNISLQVGSDSRSRVESGVLLRNSPL